MLKTSYTPKTSGKALKTSYTPKTSGKALKTSETLKTVSKVRHLRQVALETWPNLM